MSGEILVKSGNFVLRGQRAAGMSDLAGDGMTAARGMRMLTSQRCDRAARRSGSCALVLESLNDGKCFLLLNGQPALSR